MELWILRLIHIPSSVFWGGWAAMVGLFLLPAIREAGPAGGAVMAGVMQRRFALWMNALGLLSVLSGLRLWSLFFSGSWLRTGSGVSLTMGAALALVAFGVGPAVSRPTAARMGALQGAIKAGGGPPSADQLAALEGLGERAVRAGRVNAWCSIGAAVCMGAARFFPG
jgi:hypothetical protein